MSIHYGDEQGRARKISSLYISIDGKAKKVSKAWLGDELGRARLIFGREPNPYFYYHIIDGYAIVIGVKWERWNRDFGNYDIIVPNIIEDCPVIVL